MRSSRLGLIAAVAVGGVMFVVLVPLHFLEHAQYLDFLSKRYPNVYAFLLSADTIIALEFVGLSLLATAVYLLLSQRNKNVAPLEEERRTPLIQDLVSGVSGLFQTEKANKASASIGDININLHQSNHQDQTQTNKQTTERPKPVRPEPNIVFLDAKPVRVRFGDDCIYEATNGDGEAWAVKACFRNKAETGKQIIFTYAKAHVRFLNKDGQEIGEGASCVQWLGDKSGEVVEFEIDHSECVCCLLLSEQKKKIKAGVTFWKQVPSGFVHDVIFSPEMPAAIEVRLTSGTGLLLPPQLIDVSYENGKLQAKARV